jgi:hypothetical protein
VAAKPVLPWIDSPFFERELESRKGTPEQQRLAVAYHRDGYAIIERAFPPALIDAAAAEVDRMFDCGTSSLARVQDAWESGGPSRDLAVNPASLDLLRYLYGREPVPFQTLSFYRGTEQRGHADAIHFSSLPARFMCAIWVALEDVTAESGALFYYPGSHKLPELAPHDIGYTAETFDDDAYETHLEELMEQGGFEVRQFEAKKGDALIWSSNVVHGGSPILDPGATRRSQVTHYFFEDCVYYSPMLSDAPAGEYFVRTYLTDIRDGRRPVHTYNGRPVAFSPLRNGRTRITIDPSRLDRAAAVVHEATSGFPMSRRRVAGVVRRTVRRRSND